MKQKFNRFKAGLVTGLACLTFGAMFWPGVQDCRGQTSATSSPALQEVVKLTKAQMSDDIIISYIQNSGTTFQLTADDMLYLKDQGVTQPVLGALLHAKAATPVAAPSPIQQAAPVAARQAAPMVAPPQPGPEGDMPPPEPPPAEVNFTYFHDQLAPFGSWVTVGGVAYWRPDAAINANPDWRPYYDMGKWVETDNGLFWQSDYNWGDIPFHYGRWVRDPGMGWLWAPDYTWGPSWVFWRHAEEGGAVGWAPLPVGAVFVDGAFMFNGVHVGVDFDFGLGEGCYTFVDFDHFHEGFFRMRGREFRGHIYGERFHSFYHHSVVRNEFRRDEHGRFVNNGIGRERLDRATHGRMEHSGFQERKPVGNRDTLARNTSSRGNEKAGGEKSTGGGGRTTGSSSSASAASKIYRPPASSSSAGKSSAPAAKPAASSSKKK